MKDWFNAPTIIETRDCSDTITVGSYCQHQNGWWVIVKCWLWNHYRFVCSDCGQVMTKREYKQLIKCPKGEDKEEA